MRAAPSAPHPFGSICGISAAGAIASQQAERPGATFEVAPPPHCECFDAGQLDMPPCPSNEDVTAGCWERPHPFYRKGLRIAMLATRLRGGPGTGKTRPAHQSGAIGIE